MRVLRQAWGGHRRVSGAEAKHPRKLRTSMPFLNPSIPVAPEDRPLPSAVTVSLVVTGTDLKLPMAAHSRICACWRSCHSDHWFSENSRDPRDPALERLLWLSPLTLRLGEGALSVTSSLSDATLNGSGDNPVHDAVPVVATHACTQHHNVSVLSCWVAGWHAEGRWAASQQIGDTTAQHPCTRTRSFENVTQGQHCHPDDHTRCRG